MQFCGTALWCSFGSCSFAALRYSFAEQICGLATLEFCGAALQLCSAAFRGSLQLCGAALGRRRSVGSTSQCSFAVQLGGSRRSQCCASSHALSSSLTVSLGSLGAGQTGSHQDVLGHQSFNDSSSFGSSCFLCIFAVQLCGAALRCSGESAMRCSITLDTLQQREVCSW